MRNISSSQMKDKREQCAIRTKMGRELRNLTIFCKLTRCNINPPSMFINIREFY